MRPSLRISTAMSAEPSIRTAPPGQPTGERSQPGPGWRALVAMALAQGRLQEAAKIWQNLYYVIAGLGWILPLMPLIKWMERPDPDEA